MNMDWIEAWNDLERELDSLREEAKRKPDITGYVAEAIIDQLHEKMSQLKMQVFTGGQP
jgi:hypothetical protein